MKTKQYSRLVKARLVRPKNTYFTHQAGSYVNSMKYETKEEALAAQEQSPHLRVSMITWNGRYEIVKRGKFDTTL